MQFGDIGRCTARRSACSSADPFCAKAAANASSGSQTSPCASGSIAGADGWGVAR
jgi:hypothetical protein